MANYLFEKVVKLGYKIKNSDESWDFTEEPHSTRRIEILRKYPEIKKLMGYDPTIAYIVVAEFMAQLFFCWLIQDSSWVTILCMAYVIGGTLNHSLGSAIHEIGHNLAFGHGRSMWNRALGILANMPMGIPISVTYKRYHTDHHRWLGHDTKDVDIPTVIESYLFRHWFARIIWLIIHPAIHGVRPFLKSPKVVSSLEVINFVCQMIFDVIIYYVFGHKALAYLVIGTLMALGFHPLAGHFISEHYLFQNGHHATYSYYGPLNKILFNVGYHVEHHDFPYVPYSRLPEVKRIAAEYYDNLPHHTSWLKVLWDFIFEPDMGPGGRAVGYKKEDTDTAKSLIKKEKSAQINGSIANGKSHASNSNGSIANGTSHVQNSNGSIKSTDKKSQ